EAYNTATSLGNAVIHSSDSRTQALGVAAAGLYAYNNAAKLKRRWRVVGGALEEMIVTSDYLRD
ncbi:MAG: hypothetical protein LBI48_03785, partial [Burkholderiaceae bacterium]|nr:hypothetical protein [Burkholderiaceae bacterium]